MERPENVISLEDARKRLRDRTRKRAINFDLYGSDKLHTFLVDILGEDNELARVFIPSDNPRPMARLKISRKDIDQIAGILLQERDEFKRRSVGESLVELHNYFVMQGGMSSGNDGFNEFCISHFGRDRKQILLISRNEQ